MAQPLFSASRSQVRCREMAKLTGHSALLPLAGCTRSSVRRMSWGGKIQPGPTYLYPVSSMLLYYLRNPDLEAVATHANVDSASTAAAVRICPRQTDFCACDPYWSASVSADPRSIGRCKKERSRARFRSVTIVAVGRESAINRWMANPAGYREPDDAVD